MSNAKATLLMENRKTDNPQICDYGTHGRAKGRLSLIAGGMFVSATIISSFGPIWMNFASVLLLPAYVGTVLMTIGVLSLIKSRGTKTLLALIGSVLLFLDLAIFDGSLAWVLLNHPREMKHLEFNDFMMLASLVFCTGAIACLGWNLMFRSRSEG